MPPPVTAPPGASLVVDGTIVELDESRQRVADAALAVLDQLVDPAADLITGALQKPAGQGEFVVPPAAVFSTPEGNTCALRRRAGQEEAVSVQVVGGTFDRDVIRGDFQEGDEVALAAPVGSRRCG